MNCFNKNIVLTESQRVSCPKVLIGSIRRLCIDVDWRLLTRLKPLADVERREAVPGAVRYVFSTIVFLVTLTLRPTRVKAFPEEFGDSLLPGDLANTQ